MGSGSAEVLRLIVPVPDEMEESAVNTWGLSLGYSLMTGMQRLFVLDVSELEFELGCARAAGEADQKQSDPDRVDHFHLRLHQAVVLLVDPQLAPEV